MDRNLFTIALAGLVGSTLPVIAAPVVAQESVAKEEERYSVTTTLVSTLLDDPAAAAILKEIVPTVYANDMFHTMGRSQTLKAIQQYEPAALSDKNLAKIQAEFDRLPARD
jgi:hypothetical protein